MSAEEQLELIRVDPFVPLRHHTTDGRTYDVRHPDQIIVLRGRMDVGISGTDQGGVAERVEHLSLLHIVQVVKLDHAA